MENPFERHGGNPRMLNFLDEAEVTQLGSYTLRPSRIARDEDIQGLQVAMKLALRMHLF